MKAVLMVEMLVDKMVYYLVVLLDWLVEMKVGMMVVN
jgi:hypothetical protein